MKIIIIEDEPLVAKDLQKLIKAVDSEIDVITILDSLKSSAAYFKVNNEPDLLFMDVQLSDGVSFDLFNTVQIQCPIIFTTAYDEYAIRAFKLNSIDYLLKPIDKAELKLAITKFKKWRISENKDYSEQFHELFKHIGLPNTNVFKERFMAHSGKSYIIINYKQIACFIKETLIYIVTKDNQKFVTDFQTIDEIEELLNPQLFYRANRQMIIQVDSVESFRSDIYGKIIATLNPPINITVDISREKAQAFKKWVQ